jgi:hypothetical protein
MDVKQRHVSIKILIEKKDDIKGTIGSYSRESVKKGTTHTYIMNEK